MNQAALRNIRDVESAAEGLAQELLAGSFVAVAYHEDKDVRRITIWGILEITHDSAGGLLKVRMLNEPDGLAYRKRHEAWLHSVNALQIPDDELLDAFCSWTIGRRLMIYGQTAEKAKRVLSRILRGGTDRKGVLREWRHVFNRKLLERNVFRMAWRAYGPDFSAQEYNRIASEKGLAERIYQVTPQLLPILGWILTNRESESGKELERTLFGREIDTLGYFNGIRGALIERGSSKASDTDHAQALEEIGMVAQENQPDEHEVLLDFGNFEDELGERFSPAAWARLSHLPASGVRMLFQPRKGGVPNALTVMEYIAATGEKQIPLAVLRALCRDSRYHQISSLFNRRIRFVRLLLRKARGIHEPHHVLRLLQEQYPAIHDWLEARGFAESFPMENSTWTSLMRRQAEWHRNGGWRSGELPNATWLSPMERQTLDGCEVIPLTSTRELQQEGEEMQHCVATRWRLCSSGRCLIFSLRSSQGRSTLLMSKTGESWKATEHRGVRNETAPVVHSMIAQKIEGLLSHPDINQYK